MYNIVVVFRYLQGGEKGILILRQALSYRVCNIHVAYGISLFCKVIVVFLDTVQYVIVRSITRADLNNLARLTDSE